jgi:hypothetical protein
VGIVSLFALAAWVVTPSSRAETPEEIFHRGNSAYERGEYAEAAEAYRTVLQYGVQDPRLEYNLGNAAFKLGRLGEAILHYQRAYRMAPTDPEIATNLALARSRCFDKVDLPEVAPLVRVIRQAQDGVGPDRQAVAAVALIWLAAAIVAWRSARPGGWTAGWGWAIAGLVVAFLVVTVSWYSTFARVEGTRLAVVLEESVDVLAGPGENNASLFTVHEGLTIEVRSERESWLQVSLPNGLNGWVPRRSVGLV